MQSRCDTFFRAILVSLSTITLSELDEDLRISRCGSENEFISIEAIVVRELDRGFPGHV